MKFSLRNKAIFFIIAMSLAFSLVAIITCKNIITRMVNDEYLTHSTELANTVTVTLNPEEVMTLREAVMDIFMSVDEDKRLNTENLDNPGYDDYTALFDSVCEMPEFIHLRDQMKLIQDQNNVDCVYLNYFDVPTMAAIYLADADDDDPCPPGSFDQYDMDSEETQNTMKDPTVGYPAYINNSEMYGWLLTVGVPVYSSDNEVICYLCVDVDMNQIREDQIKIILLFVGILAVLSALVCIIGYILMNRFIVKPIKMLSGTAANYCNSDNTILRHDFSDLKITNHDEIGVLSDSMKKMESDINDYYSKLITTRQELITSKEEANRMGEIANRDALTGIRNKRAYNDMLEQLNADIKQGNARFGIAMVDLNYLKTINDVHDHEKGDIAIRKLCRIICFIFGHSPVFRIGGDEFAIVLKNGDYDNIDDLVKKFNREISENIGNNDLPAWEKVSAAIGYTYFKPGEDESADEVFRRADSLMYDRKREMKSGDVR